MPPRQRDPTIGRFARTPTPHPDESSLTPPATVERPGPTGRITGGMAGTDDVGASGGNENPHDEIEAARLRIRELELQLQIAQLNASNNQQTGIRLIHDKMARFEREVVSKSLTITFKLEGSTNYNAWRDKALTQALAIKAKDILQKLELTCPDSITDPEDKKIWEIKNETMFDILLGGLKPAVRQLVKSRIDEDQKNAAELWQALETEYRIHAADK